MNEDLGYASEGAVKQEGSLKVHVCKRCASLFVWATSKRTGKCYMVNVQRGHLDQKFYMKNDFHKCDEVLAKQAETEARDLRNIRNQEIIKAVQATDDMDEKNRLIDSMEV